MNLSQFKNELRRIIDGDSYRWQTSLKESPSLLRDILTHIQSIQTDPSALESDDFESNLRECQRMLELNVASTTIYQDLNVDKAICERLIRNLRALMASAVAAFIACQEDHANRATEFQYWTFEVVKELLDSKDITIIGEKPIDRQTLAPWRGKEFVEHALHLVGAQRLRVVAARCWILYWLQDGDIEPQDTSEFLSISDSSREIRHKTDNLRVPVACYDEKRSCGQVVFLDLFLVDTRKELPVEHPDMALCLIDNAFREAIHAAADQFIGGTVCWRLRMADASVPYDSWLEGNSLGTAAWAGCSLLRGRQSYDPGCILLGGIAGQKVAPVVREREKLEAIVEWNRLHPAAAIHRAIVSQNTYLRDSDIETFLLKGLHVIKCSTLTEAVDLAAGLSHELMQYLDPESDAGPNPSLPLLLPAFALLPESTVEQNGQEPAAFPEIAFDLRTCWGLDRGQFVGIYAAESEFDAFDSLWQIEQQLDSIQSDEASWRDHSSLPRRWWFRLRFDPGQQDLQSIANLWKTCDLSLYTQKENNSDFTGRLQNMGLPGGAIPGFFITLTADQRPTSLENIVNWCVSIFHRLFPHKAVAVVIHVCGESVAKRENFAVNLDSRLRVRIAVPIESMTIPASKNKLDLEPFTHSLSMSQSAISPKPSSDDASSNKLNKNQFSTLLQALTSAYPDLDDLRLMLRLRLNERLELITGDSPKMKVFELITWAESEGRLNELLREVQADKPNNEEIRHIVQHYPCLTAIQEEPFSAFIEPSGGTFAAWVNMCKEVYPEEFQQVCEERHYPLIISVCSQYTASRRGSAIQAVKTLQSLLANPDFAIRGGETEEERNRKQMFAANPVETRVQLHREFLSIIRHFLPDYIDALLRAYAQEGDRDALRCSAAFASQSDAMMDSWIDGTRLMLDRFPQRYEILPDPVYGAFQESLVLGLMRKFRREGATDVRRAEIQRILDLWQLSETLRSVCRFCFTCHSLQDFPADLDDDQVRIAIRANAGITLSLQNRRLFPLERSARWHSLGATRPEPEMMKALFAMSPKQRAVFGLCTSLEWQSLTCPPGRPDRPHGDHPSREYELISACRRLKRPDGYQSFA